MALTEIWEAKRDSSAAIQAAPVAYNHSSPPKKHNIIAFDCRGLEFTDFKADVSPMKDSLKHKN